MQAICGPAVARASGRPQPPHDFRSAPSFVPMGQVCAHWPQPAAAPRPPTSHAFAPHPRPAPAPRAAAPALLPLVPPWGRLELLMVSALADAHQAFWPLLSDPNGDSRAAAPFLRSLENTATGLGSERASRDYRLAFSANYRTLFPDGSRNYRVDVLEGALEAAGRLESRAGADPNRNAVIWVNGRKYEVGRDAIGFAVELQIHLASLGNLLSQWRIQAERTNFPRCDFMATLRLLDAAWASFENNYICNLMLIEEQARQLVSRAVDANVNLSQYERDKAGRETVSRARGDLTARLGQLNAVANTRRRGRDDLRGDVLEAALEVLGGEADAAVAAASAADAPTAARVLAGDIVATFRALRDYLQEVGQCLQAVDPHLCNNLGLVARLGDWEESWEVGGTYVLNRVLLDALDGLVAVLRDAQRVAPSLERMCDEYSVELFLILPRLTLLSFLSAPTGNQADLLQTLLPHHFDTPQGTEQDRRLTLELKILVDHFDKTACFLMAAADASSPCDESGRRPTEAFAKAAVDDPRRAVAWGVLVRRAVRGSAADAAEERAELFDGLVPELRGAARTAVDEFSIELERWSLELQRTCPADWNQFSAVLVQCLSGVAQRTRSTTFQV